jgi:hypothetical protein
MLNAQTVAAMHATALVAQDNNHHYVRCKAHHQIWANIDLTSERFPRSVGSEAGVRPSTIRRPVAKVARTLVSS